MSRCRESSGASFGSQITPPAKHIIAINTDPAAPILGRADYAVIGDLHEIIPALVKALRDRS